jgi:two-component system phosphate regulon response regulator PhoB
MVPLVFLVQEPLKYQVKRSPSPLRDLLQTNRYAVHTAPASQPEVLDAAERRRPALFIMDAPLDLSLELCLAIRQSPRLMATPVVIVADKECEDDRVRSYEQGADEFMGKPLRPRETLARIQSLLRRSASRPASARVEVGPVAVDTDSFTLSVRGTRVAATATQVRLIEYLMRHQGRVFSRDQILDAVWSDSRFVTPRTIDVHIRRIRELIELDPAKPAHLKTMRGAGYCFVGEDRAQAIFPSAALPWLSPPGHPAAVPFTAGLAGGRVPRPS